MNPRLDVILEVSTPVGPLSLNTGPYELTGDSFATVSVTHRRQEATNAFIEGTYTVNSLRENIIVPVGVYVRGSLSTDMQRDKAVLTAVFDQSTFEVRRVIEGHEEFWQCFASDYTVTMQRELLHATMAKVDVQLMTHPGARVWTNQASGFWTPVAVA